MTQTPSKIVEATAYAGVRKTCGDCGGDLHKIEGEQYWRCQKCGMLWNIDASKKRT